MDRRDKTKPLVIALVVLGVIVLIESVLAVVLLSRTGSPPRGLMLVLLGTNVMMLLAIVTLIWSRKRR